ncbi:RHS repeat domain-containing protein [Roseibacillus persicicus]|uniref:RHS repeat domain-containing protein n=1 Tax=Roseibacillus persicicus TaxID=454148 RepID=UPI0035E98B2D
MFSLLCSSAQSQESCASEFEWTITFDGQERGNIFLGPGDIWDVHGALAGDLAGIGQGGGGGSGNVGSSSVDVGGFIYEMPELSSCQAGACGFEAEESNGVIKIVPVSNKGAQSTGGGEDEEGDGGNKSWGGGGTASCSSCQGKLISEASTNTTEFPSISLPQFSSYAVCGGRLMLLFDIDPTQASLLGNADWLKHFRLSEAGNLNLESLAAETSFSLSNEQYVIVTPDSGQMMIRVYESQEEVEPVSSLKLSQQNDTVVVEGFSGDVVGGEQDFAFHFSSAPDFDGESNLYGMVVSQGLEFTSVRGDVTKVSRHYSRSNDNLSTDDSSNPSTLVSRLSDSWSRDEWISENRVSEKLEILNIATDGTAANERFKIRAKYDLVGGQEILVKYDRNLYDILVPMQRAVSVHELEEILAATGLSIVNGSVLVGNGQFHELLVEEESNGRLTRHYYDDFDNSHFGQIDYTSENNSKTYNAASQDPRYTKRMATVFPDGSWERYIYSSTFGERIAILRPFLDNGLLTSEGGSLPSPLSITYFLEVLVGENGESEMQEIDLGNASRFVVPLPALLTAAHFPDYDFEAVSGSDGVSESTNDGEILLEVPSPWSENGFAERVVERDSGLGVSDLFSYQYGTIAEGSGFFVESSSASDATHYREISYIRAVGSSATELEDAVSTNTQIDYGSDRFLRGKTTRRLRTFEIESDENQLTTDLNEIFSSLSYWNGVIWASLPESDTVQSEDGDGNQVSTVYFGGLVQSQTVEIDSTTTVFTDQTGLKTTNSYDPVSRTSTSVTAAVNDGAPQRTVTVVSTPGFLTLPVWLGGGDLPVRTTITTEQVGALFTSSTQVSDWNGRLLWEESEGGFIRSVAYEDLGRTTKNYRGNIYFDENAILLASNARYLDGKAKSQTAGPSLTTYSYTVDAATSQLTTNINRDGVLSTTVTDDEGQLLSQSRPSAEGVGDVVITEVDSNNDGVVDQVNSTDPLSPSIFYGNDGQGNQLVGIDVDGSGSLTADSADRYSSSDSMFQQDIGILWRKTEQFRLSAPTAKKPSDTTVYYSRVSLPAAEFGQFPRLIGHSRTEFPSGETREVVTQVTAVGEVTTTTTSSAEEGAEVVVTRGGQVASRTTSDAEGSENWVYRYNPNGLVTTYTDARGGVTITTTNRVGQVVSVEQPAIKQAVKYQFHPAGINGEGQVRSVTNNAGETTFYQYNLSGRVSEVSGDTYQLSYTYIPGGQMDTLTTYRDEGNSTITKWKYQAGTGLLEEKLYDSDPTGSTGQGPLYRYYPGGQLKERLWVRGINPDGSGERIKTTYSYSNLGDLESISYNDGVTADVIYSNHDRLGRPMNVAQVLDQVTIHSATLAYSSEFGGLASEAYGVGFLENKVLNYQRGSRSQSGFQDVTSVFDVGSNTPEYERTWTAMATRSDSPATIALSRGPSATYHEYLEGTSHPRHYSVSLGTGSTDVHHHRHFDLGGRVTGVLARQGSATGSILTSAGYKYNSAGRREWLTREDGTRWEFGYNSKGEVTSGKKRLPNGGDLLAGQQFEYDYDGIGNRKTAKYGGDQNGSNLRNITYAPNDLNQYGTITYSGHISLIGFGDSSTEVVSVSPGILTESDRADQLGNRWWRELHLQSPATTTGVLVELTLEENATAIPGSGGKLWLDPISYVPSHDLDGNLTTDARWNYKWNGENRLIEMTTNLSSGQPWMRLTFAYDWQGRRVWKRVETGSSSNPSTEEDLHFLYDGWNLIAEYDSLSTGQMSLKSSFLWGPDVSGSSQGAGGVGGLVVVISEDENYQPSYDGNGNIISWLNESGAVVQRNDYDPFGDLISKHGSVEDLNFGFSTKYTDEETGLAYYGYRYYDPVTGRWLSRDPIEERGGINLYGMVGNNAVGKWDVLGMVAAPKWYSRDAAKSDWGAKKGFGLRPDVPGASNVGPYQLGWEWLTGNGPTNREFGPGSMMVNHLKNHHHIASMREEIKKKVIEICRCESDDSILLWPLNLGGIEGMFLYMRDYSVLAKDGLKKAILLDRSASHDVVVAYLGGFGAKAYVNAECGSLSSGTETIAHTRFQVWNESTVGSITHPPVIGYTQFWGDYIEPYIEEAHQNHVEVNPTTGRRPGDTTRQDFVWDEQINGGNFLDGWN